MLVTDRRSVAGERAARLLSVKIAGGGDVAYSLGIDLGTTFIGRGDRPGRAGRDGRRSATAPRSPEPSVVLRATTGRCSSARPRAGARQPSPDRVAREFKRRLGDPTPILLGGDAVLGRASSWPRLLRDVVDAGHRAGGRAAARRGADPPGELGPVQARAARGRRRRRRARGPDRCSPSPRPPPCTTRVTPRARPRATSSPSTTSAAARSTPRCCASAATAFELLGEPEGIERLGGIDFDEAVLAHVDRALGGALTALDPGRPATAVARSRALRQDCVAAKEALSVDTDATIPVLLPNAADRGAAHPRASSRR